MQARRLAALLGAGAAAGMAVGLVRGVVEVRACGHWSHGTPWLAWSRLSRTSLEAGLVGLAVALGAVLLLYLLSLLGSIPSISPAPSSSGARLLSWATRGLRSIGGAFDRARAGARPPELLSYAALVALAALAVLVPLETTLGSWRAAGRPSVILVSIDTLRADRLADLPKLAALAREGTTFTHAMAAAPWTFPSHTALFTSRLPFDHRVPWTRAPLTASQSMLAERFRDAGYRTAAFTGGVYVGAAFGFGQGFEVYEDHDELKEGGSQGIFGRALDWVRGHRDAPFFLFLHTYEVHNPYTHAGSAGATLGRLSAPFTTANAEDAYHGRLRLTPEERDWVRRLYDGDARAADRAVGGFLETLRGEGVLDDAVLVVLSDHGEDLWDHVENRSPGHGHSLYESLVHVPLVFRAPGRVAAGTRLTAPVSLIDVAPTLLALCGLHADPTHRGTSLAASLARGTEPPPLRSMAESVEYGPDRFALREGSLKVVVTPHPERVHNQVRLDVLPIEAYDLAADPGEKDPASGRHHPRFLAAVESLQQRARAALESARPAGETADEPLPEEVLDQLRSLGYVR